VTACLQAAAAGQESLPEPGYWTLAQLAAYMQTSRWTVRRRIAADPAFPVLTTFGAPRFPVERVKAYLQRQEQGRGRAYKSRGLLRLPAQTSTTVDAGDPEAAP